MRVNPWKQASTEQMAFCTYKIKEGEMPRLRVPRGGRDERDRGAVGAGSVSVVVSAVSPSWWLIRTNSRAGEFSGIGNLENGKTRG